MLMIAISQQRTALVRAGQYSTAEESARQV
jgi:hypothetical protein